jgi:cytochrome d ubiquinol oxidase subunit I
MVTAALISTGLFVGASGAWHLLQGNRGAEVKKMFSMAMWSLLITAPLQVVIGDMHGLNTLEHQPAKVAAMEGHWENKPGESVPLILFGLPDMEAERTRYKIEIPMLGSLILTHTLNGQYPGLKEFRPQDRPNASIIFWTFRAMVGLGFLMILLAFWSALSHWRGRPYESRALVRFALLMGPTGLIALLAGWYTTEIGRQPWVVYGLMRTADAVSNHSELTLSVTLIVLLVVYVAVFGTGIGYMLKLVKQGPDPLENPPDADSLDHRPARPLSAATESAHPPFNQHR